MKKKFKSSARFTLVICILLLIANAIFDLLFILISWSKVKEQLSNHALSIANIAAEMVDGDKVKMITSETTKDAAVYKETYDILNDFATYGNFKYIYIARLNGQDENGRNQFTFIIDQDPDNPGKYGEKVEYTDALDSASKGKASVDMKPYTDKWGTFYSAFSPIYDSTETMVGIIGIDIPAKTYERDIYRQGFFILAVGVFSLAIGSVIALLFTREMRKRYRVLNDELTLLSKEIDSLSLEISEKQNEVFIGEKEEEHFESSDDVTDLPNKMIAMQKEIRRYIDYVHAQAYVDLMTGVSSKTAYLELVKEIEQKIKEEKADFKVIVFDINGLKVANDNYGHEYGDLLVINTAKVIKGLFDKKQIFRIGGDEFIVIIEDETDKTVEENEHDIRVAINNYNANVKENEIKISCSYGGAHYNPRIDNSFKEVFKRADEEMYRSKGLYYQKYGDRRKNTK